MTEVEMWRLIRRKWTEAHVTRIENAISSGSPDVHCAYNGKENWFELKVHKRLIKFRPSQLGWMSQRKAAGRNTWILTYDGEEWFLYSFISALEANAFIMHLSQPHLDTGLVPPVEVTMDVKRMLTFV